VERLGRERRLQICELRLRDQRHAAQSVRRPLRRLLEHGVFSVESDSEFRAPYREIRRCRWNSYRRRIHCDHVYQWHRRGFGGHAADSLRKPGRGILGLSCQLWQLCLRALGRRKHERNARGHGFGGHDRDRNLWVEGGDNGVHDHTIIRLG